MVSFITQGVSAPRFFFFDQNDTGMDFFNSMIYVKGRHPYTQYHTVYPPLANMFFWLISHFVSPADKMLWPETYEDSVAIRMSALDLRVSQTPMIIFLIYMIVITLAVTIIMSSYFKKTYYGLVFGISVLLSYGCLFAIERGNIIVISLCFLFLFLRFYDSDNKVIRELALISLAIAAGIKLYPALFGVLLVLEKKWLEAVRTVIYGVLSFVLPFAMFDGVEGFQCFLKELASFSSKDSEIQSVSRYHLQGIIRSIFLQLGQLFHFDAMPFVKHDYTMWFLLITCIMLGGVFVFRKTWKRLLIIGCVVLFVQDSIQYTLVFLLPALVYLCVEEEVSRKSIAYFVLLTLLSLPIPIMGWLSEYRLYYLTMLGQDLLAILVLLILADIIITLSRIVKDILS